MNIYSFSIYCCLLLTFEPLYAETTVNDEEFTFDLEFNPDIATEIEAKTANKDSTNKIDRSALRYSLDYELSINPSNSQGLVNDRLSAQIEFDKLVSDKLYAKVDLIGNLYLSQDHVSKSAGKTYESDSRLKEAWLQYSWNSQDLKIGKQNIVWSEVDSSRATDTINAVDNSELLFIDFEDARLGQWMISSRYYKDEYSVEGFINLKPEFDRIPAQNSIYAFSLPIAIEKAQTPDPEAGLRYKVKIAAAELALLAANLAPNQPAFEVISVGLQPVIREKANRFWLSGINMNIAQGNILWKADLAYKTDQTYNNLLAFSVNGINLIQKDVIDFAVGAEYTEQQHVLDFSATRTVIKNWQSSLTTKRQTGLFLFSWSKPYFNEELSLNATIGKLYNEASQYAFLYADYAYDDHIKIITSLFLFDIATENILLAPLNENDRLSIKIKYQI